MGVALGQSEDPPYRIIWVIQAGLTAISANRHCP
jgi:hypothetical protein